MKKHQIINIQSGFTFIELIIAVSIVGILAIFAYPNYLKSTQKSQRTAAKTALLDLASREAIYYSTNNSYTATMTALGYANNYPASSPTSYVVPNATTPYYTLTVVLDANDPGYTATATPTGTQAKDQCGSYTINYLGIKTPANTTSLICW